MTYVYSFLVGGLLCVVAQVLIDKTKITPAYTSRSRTSPRRARRCR